MEQLAQLDLDLDQVRAEAADGACRFGDDATPSRADEGACFEISAREFVRGAAEPPDGVDRDDFENSVGRVIVSMRRTGDRLATATLRVRYQFGSGRVLAIDLRRDDGAEQREVYRRPDGGLSATA